MAIVSFPSPWQGEHAYRCLREYRMMHEHCWEPSVENNTMQENGQLPPKRERIKMLQNQRANSIADIAATLKLQERDGAKQMAVWRKKWKQWDQREEKEWHKARSLAKRFDRGELPELRARIAELEAELPTFEKEDLEKYERTKREIQRANQEADLMQKAPNKVRIQQERKDDLRTRAAKFLSRFEWKNEKKRAFIEELMVRSLYHYHYTNYWRELQPARNLDADQKARPGEYKLKDIGSHSIDNVNTIIDQLFPMQSAGWFSMQGVQVRWADESDMNHAKDWPEDVKHIMSGQYMRYLAWHPDVMAQREKLAAAQADTLSRSSAEEASKSIDQTGPSEPALEQKPKPWWQRIFRR